MKNSLTNSLLTFLEKKKLKNWKEKMDIIENGRFERDREDLKISCSENICDYLLLDCSLFHDRADKRTLNDYISEY